MRVLLISGSYPPEACGIGDYTHKLAQALANIQELHVGVLTNSKFGRTKSERFDLIEPVSDWDFANLLGLVRSIQEWKPDLVHIQYPSQGFFFRRMPAFLPVICRLLGIKVIQTWHEPYRLISVFHFCLLTIGADGLVFVRPNYLKLLPTSFKKIISRYPSVTVKNAGALPVSSLRAEERQKCRNQYLGKHSRLIVFFGFLYPSKGVELLFDIASPATDSLVISGAIKDEAYVSYLVNIARDKGWNDDQICLTGFIEQQDAANLLAVADAVVLPFLSGGGEWNTSIHSALDQGTLVITTAVPPRGDESQRNLYTAEPTDIKEMREALNRLAGRKIKPSSTDIKWQEIAEAHYNFYHHVLGMSRKQL
ncbi:Glycosyl transferases group 1 [anaerobic digester metagenome]